MPTYCAFLRAINVGGRFVRMDDLRRMFEGLLFTDVRTVVASGNVVFETAARGTQTLAKRIDDHLTAALGYDVTTFVRSAAGLKAIAEHRPFGREVGRAGGTLFVVFLATQPRPAAARRLLSLATPTDAFHLLGRELYWRRQGGFSDSAHSGATIEKTLGMPVTVRKITTVEKVLKSCMPARKV